VDGAEERAVDGADILIRKDKAIIIEHTTVTFWRTNNEAK
jgi:hypothetical protein